LKNLKGEWSKQMDTHLRGFYQENGAAANDADQAVTTPQHQANSNEYKRRIAQLRKKLKQYENRRAKLLYENKKEKEKEQQEKEQQEVNNNTNPAIAEGPATSAVESSVGGSATLPHISSSHLGVGTSSYSNSLRPSNRQGSLVINNQVNPAANANTTAKSVDFQAAGSKTIPVLTNGNGNENGEKDIGATVAAPSASAKSSFYLNQEGAGTSNALDPTVGGSGGGSGNEEIVDAASTLSFQKAYQLDRAMVIIHIFNLSYHYLSLLNLS
jgi:hypothetical protein